MTTLDDKKVEWLYDHFQGITKRSDQLLVLFAVLFVSAIAILSSSNDPIELPFLKVSAGRETLLGCTLLSAFFTLIAFFGNYDYGERALLELCSVLQVEYDDIWFVDTHPTIVDFARFRRHESSKKRRLVSRFGAALVYPLLLLSALLWLSVIWIREVWLQSMRPLEAAAFILALPLIVVSWHRGLEYFGRRWQSWRVSESARREDRPDKTAIADPKPPSAESKSIKSEPDKPANTR